MKLISIRKVKRRIISPKICRAMKFTFLLVVLSVSSAFCMTSYSQTANITLQMNNASVEDVLNKIEEESEFRFLYNKKLVNVNRTINVSVNEENIAGVLNKVFENDDVEYTIYNRQIVLSKKSGAGVGVSSVQQANPVRGTIIDRSGETLIGVSVSIKGATTGTITDIDGRFLIDASKGSVLRVSYLGYITQEITIGDNRDLRIVLEENTQELETVVVVGFGTQKKESITGAISAISGDELMTTNASTTSTALAGKIAGINTRMPDGRPGAGTKIRIRGMGTPLYVIDGVQKDEGQFNNIDPNDIENLSVLKDAAAAIYGVRAANGVIVVTTKSGKRNSRNTVNVNASYGWQDMFRFPEPSSTKTYVTAKYQSDIIKKASDPNYNMTYTRDQYEKWMQGTEKGYWGFDWKDYILKTAPQYYVGANMSGGSEDINYYMAISHLGQDAIIRNYGGFYRTNVQFNVDANITKKLKIGATMSGRIEERKHPGVPGGDDTWQALFAVYRNLPTVRPFANDNPDYPAKTSAGGETNFGMLTYEKSGEFEETWKVIQMNLTAEYKIMDGLSIKALGGYYLGDYYKFNHEYTYQLYYYDEATDTYHKDGDGMTNPWMEKQYDKVEETSFQATVDFKRKFNQHTLAVVAGAEANKKKNPSLWLHDRPAANAINSMYPSTMAEINDYLNRTEARAGFIGKVNYDYEGKYLLELIGRYDGSWKFPKGDRWGFFPSVSVGWRLSEEAFWQNIKNTVNNLKVRASYGIVGDDATPDYAAYDYLSGYQYAGKYKDFYNDEKNVDGAVIGGEWIAGSKNRGLPVRTLSWMEAKMLNVGFDFGLLDDRLSGEFNYFTRKLDGIPEVKNDILIPVETGFEAPKENLKSEMIKGIDGTITWRDKIQDFNYSVSGNLTFARQYDWHQYKPRFGNSWNEYRNSINERYAFINWGYQVIGRFKDWEEIANYPVNVDGKGNTTIRPGDFIYKDVNKDGIINEMDERPIGYRAEEDENKNVVPYFNYNFTFNFGYKGFDLGLTFSGASFASLMLNYELKRPFHDGGNNPQFLLGDQWRLSDIHDANSVLIPGRYPTSIEGNADHVNYKANDFWLLNVNYLKLRNLELGYSVPKKIIDRAKIQKLRIYTSMQNLFSIDNLGNVDIDPEINKGSGVQYPTNRVISIGCNLTF